MIRADVLRRVSVLLAATLAGTAALAGPSRPAADPAEHYGRLPQFRQLELSPSGDKMLTLQAQGDTYHLVVVDFKTESSRLVLAADPNAFLYNWCRWASETRILCSTRAYDKRKQDGTTYRTTETRLIAVNDDRTELVTLYPHRAIKYYPVEQDMILSVLPNDPDHVLIALNRDQPALPSVYRVNIRTNTYVRIEPAQRHINRWLVDDLGEVRLGYGEREERPYAIFKDPVTNSWTPIDPGLLGDDLSAILHAVSTKNQRLYWSARGGSDKQTLFDIDTNRWQQPRPLVSDAAFDVDGRMVMNPKTGAPLYHAYWQHTQHVTWFDQTMADHYASLKVRLGGYLSILHNNSDGTRWLVRHWQAGSAPVYYAYDTRTPQLVLVGEDYPQTPSTWVTTKTAVSYPAADGRIIPAYLSLPATAETKIPTIVLPHGGPFVRGDRLDFDVWVQLLTAEGYAVLQPAFRGTRGYGAAHANAGRYQWGKAMQSDLLDGLDWMIESGRTDPDRVCMVGASYGGYAALLAAYQTPERLRCAISFAGVTNLPAMLRQWQKFEHGRYIKTQIRGDDTSAQSLRDLSPRFNAKRFGVEVLLVQGSLDRRVYFEQAKSLARALRRAKKPHRFVFQAGGDHHLSRASHRLEFFREMRDFLAKHLKAPEPVEGDTATQ